MCKGHNMNKIKSSENIFPFYPLPCWKKLGGEKNKKIAAEEKNESCAEYTPLYFQERTYNKLANVFRGVYSAQDSFSPQLQNISFFTHLFFLHKGWCFQYCLFYLPLLHIFPAFFPAFFPVGSHAPLPGLLHDEFILLIDYLFKA